MSPRMALRDRPVGPGHAPLVIAELGINHDGHLDRMHRMIDDAAKSGVRLSGGGFRTKEQQIALRKSNGCPDVWTAPAS